MTSEQTTKIDFASSANQEILRTFVGREVSNCVSSLISHFASCSDALDGSGYDWEDIHALCCRDDWEEPFEESDFEMVENSEGDFYAIDRKEFPATIDNFTDEFDVEAAEQFDDYLAENSVAFASDWDEDDPDWREACELVGIDEPHTHEAYEHWIVTEWLARKLEEHGQITGEFFGLPIWGRCTTGQAILLDYVIGQIAAEEEILEGQKYDWSKQK